MWVEGEGYDGKRVMAMGGKRGRAKSGKGGGLWVGKSGRVRDGLWV